MRRNVEPHAGRDQGEELRWDRLYNEPCDLVLRTAEEPLRALYDRYSGAETLLGEPRKMCLKEWGQMLDAVGLLDGCFTMKTARFCYIRAMETEPDEMQSDGHRQMGYLEFLEAIARVAETKDLTWGAVQRGSISDAAAASTATTAATAVAATDATVGDEGEQGVRDDAVPPEDETLAHDMRKPGLGPLHLRLQIVIDALAAFQAAENASTRRGSTK